MPRPPAAPACLGPNDLNVDGQHLELDGPHTFDRVCLVHQARLRLAGTLRAGALYVDATSGIDNDGLPGGSDAGDPGAADYCTPSGSQKPEGASGASMTIVARTATILGPLSANGGTGAAATDDTGQCSIYPGGAGGAGGHIAIEAADLTLTAPITATGGAGGPGSAANQFGHAGGAGGAGGMISLLLPRQPDPTLAALLHVTGGKGGSGQPLGAEGVPGQIALGTLTAAQLAALPPVPAPPLLWAGPLPTSLPPLPAAAFEAGMACGAGDLVVAAGTTMRLGGTRTYPHVCLQAGSTLLAGRGLSLRAATMAIEQGARISADGAIPAPPGLQSDSSQPPGTGYPADGRYESAGAREAGPAAPHGGVPGATESTMQQWGPITALGGAGGGAIALIAGRIWLAGTVSANGATGTTGQDEDCPVHYCYGPYPGAGGGSGGGILLVAGELQLAGAISAVGGAGGSGGQGSIGEAPGGMPGSSGYVKVRVNTLRAAPGDLPLAGPALISLTLPGDPVAAVPQALQPVAAPAGNPPHTRYFPGTRHTLRDPFLSFWDRHGNGPIFGAPLSEAFTEGGQTVQYLERARLVIVGGQVTLSPLGRWLTAGRSFPPVAPVPTTASQRYFPESGHILAGRFLAFWQAHDGPLVLGPPISEPLREQNGDGSGRTYLVQYCLNARLEYHPELAGTPYVVSLGLIAKEYLRRLGWI